MSKLTPLDTQICTDTVTNAKLSDHLIVGGLDSVEWNGRLECWNGMVEWNGGMEWCNRMLALVAYRLVYINLRIRSSV